jgi:F-type H+-transporting ATPase subunit alpha
MCSLQTVVVYAATKGYLDKVPVNKITGTEEVILKHVDPKIFKILKAQGKISPAINAHLAQQMSNLPL